MYKFFKFIVLGCVLIAGCASPAVKEDGAMLENFEWQVDRFEDVAVMRHQVPGFEKLSLQQKTLVYYLN